MSENRPDVTVWLGQSEYDLKAAKWMLKGEFYAHAVFMLSRQ